MHGGAVTLANRLLEDDFKPDLLLATDMVDVTVLLSLTRERLRNVPLIIYMHENQLNYPWSEQDRDVQQGRDHHYAFINYTSALAADRVVFNSEYHRTAFLTELPRFLRMYPDHRNESTIDQIRGKSVVLPVGLNLSQFDEVESVSYVTDPVVLWNHRWEYDKQPEVFFKTLIKLSEEGHNFKLIVCGECTDVYPDIFDQMRQKLAAHVIHWGYAQDKAEYARLLRMSDILPVTSHQDFFGISVVEAMYCGVYPLMPDRLAFPEHVPQSHRDAILYSTEDELIFKLRELLTRAIPDLGQSEWVRHYDWSKLIGAYDKMLSSVLTN